jgi:hypothetical protein
LYVVRPDDLIECSTQVAGEVAGLVTAAATQAGLQARIDSGELVGLLEKLLMVQVGRHRLWYFLLRCTPRHHLPRGAGCSTISTSCPPSCPPQCVLLVSSLTLFTQMPVVHVAIICAGGW